MWLHDSGRIDQHVERTESFRHFPHELCRGPRLREIRSECGRFATSRFDQLDGFVSFFARGVEVHRYRHALGTEGYGECAANAMACTRNERNTSHQLHATSAADRRATRTS